MYFYVMYCNCIFLNNNNKKSQSSGYLQWLPCTSGITLSFCSVEDEREQKEEGSLGAFLLDDLDQDQ